MLFRENTLSVIPRHGEMREFIQRGYLPKTYTQTADSDCCPWKSSAYLPPHEPPFVFESLMKNLKNGIGGFEDLNQDMASVEQPWR
jgi:hypothetical protein